MKLAAAVLLGLVGAVALGFAHEAWIYGQPNTWRPLAAIGFACLALAGWLGLH